MDHKIKFVYKVKSNFKFSFDNMRAGNHIFFPFAEQCYERDLDTGFWVYNKELATEEQF